VFVSITTTQGRIEDQELVAQMAAEALTEWLSHVEGFAGLLTLIDVETSTAQVLVFWETREIAEKHREARLRLRDRIAATAQVEVVETRGYELAFSSLDALPVAPG
jgi:tRNA G26 N,N-dimethylase Trm1